jgi:hypothetical protein
LFSDVKYYLWQGCYNIFMLSWKVWSHLGVVVRTVALWAPSPSMIGVHHPCPKYVGEGVVFQQAVQLLHGAERPLISCLPPAVVAEPRTHLRTTFMFNAADAPL